MVFYFPETGSYYVCSPGCPGTERSVCLYPWKWGLPWKVATMPSFLCFFFWFFLFFETGFLCAVLAVLFLTYVSLYAMCVLLYTEGSTGWPTCSWWYSWLSCAMWVLGGNQLHAVKEQQVLWTDKPVLQVLLLNDLLLFVCGVRWGCCVCAQVPLETRRGRQMP